MQDMTLSLVQPNLEWESPAANRQKLADLLFAERELGELILLPEMFTTGFTMAAAEQAEPMHGATEEWMRDLAAGLQTTITGSIIVRDNGRYFNRLIWMPPDGQSKYYDKRHLFRMVGEQETFTAGEKRLIVKLGDWKICPLVCYDLRFPVWSRGNNDYDLLLYVSNWPSGRRSAWETLLPARAVENLCYCAGVNRVGSDGNGVDYVGDSGVWDYYGHRLLDSGDQESITHVRLDAEALSRYRKKFPAHLDADPFNL